MSDKVLERKTFQEGDLLFKEGDEPTHALIIQTGEVQILLNADQDDQVILATVGPGGIIGEMALLDTTTRMATARATTGGAAIIVTKQVFDIKMQKTDPFVRGLLLILADRARQLTAKQSYSDVSSETESVTDSQAATDAASQINA
jgi:CRP-like cAMP-binding protein